VVMMYIGNCVELETADGSEPNVLDRLEYNEFDRMLIRRKS
jgi:hypothetical protein